MKEKDSSTPDPREKTTYKKNKSIYYKYTSAPQIHKTSSISYYQSKCPTLEV